MASCRQGRHQASNQSSTTFGLKNFFRAAPARSAGKPMEHSYRYRLRFGGPIWLPKLPSIFPRVFENFQATDRSISHARRYKFPKIATGNRTILVSLSMFYAGHRWYMWGLMFSSLVCSPGFPLCGSTTLSVAGFLRSPCRPRSGCVLSPIGMWILSRCASATFAGARA